MCVPPHPYFLLNLLQLCVKFQADGKNVATLYRKTEAELQSKGKFGGFSPWRSHHL